MAGVKYVGKVKGLVKVTRGYVEARCVCPYSLPLYNTKSEPCCDYISGTVWINPQQSTVICPCAKCVSDLTNNEGFRGRVLLIDNSGNIIEGGE